MSVIATAQSAKNSALDVAERLIDSRTGDIDVQTHFFYVYKAFPAELSTSELKQWADLQEDLLSPFAIKYIYKYTSNAGIHLWYSKTEILGIPETAAQPALKNGVSWQNGKHFRYQQTWEDGVMTSCLALKHENSDAPLSDYFETNDTSQYWAVQRQIDEIIAKPATWLVLLASLFGLNAVWLIFSYATLAFQTHWIELNNQELSEAIGPRLTQRQSMADAQATVTGLSDWRFSYVNFPNAIGQTFAELTSLAEVTVNRWQWQNNTLIIEITSPQIDITQLVENTQTLEQVESANIRPHNSPDTWVLELTWR